MAACSEAAWGRDARMDGAVHEAGFFDALGDDDVLAIMRHLVKIPTDATIGLKLQRNVKRGLKDIGALLAACKRMDAVLASVGRLLKMELVARGSTQIAPTPRMLQSSENPYTEQVRLESRSSDQLKNLRDAIAGMAVHCAGPCCAHSRGEVNRQLKDRGIVTPVVERSTVLSPSANGAIAFVSSRRRVSKLATRHGNRSSRHEEMIIQFGTTTGRQSSSKSTTAHSVPHELCRISLENDDRFSAPQVLRSNNGGTAVAIIRALHTAAADETIPHSIVGVWQPMQNLNDGRCSNAIQSIPPPVAAQDIGVINAQEAWWAVSSEDAEENLERLVVLWSTAYVHPMGTVVGANADNACYIIALYELVDGEDEDAQACYELHSYIGPFAGKAQTANPTKDGNEAVVLVRNPPLGNGPGSLATRCTRIHGVMSEEPIELDHKWRPLLPHTSLLSHHPDDSVHCPSCVAISPSGDCVIAIHSRRGTVILEVLIRTEPGVFVSVQTMDVTHWTAIGQSEPTVFDQDDHQANAGATVSLKLPYHIGFSPCGRFAAILDKRTTFGLPITNHAVVVLDMAARNERRGVRALPLAPVEDVAPRSLEWTDTGMWLQPRYGSLLISNV